MAKNEIITGLDLGSANIYVTVGELSPEGRLDIIGVGSAPSCGIKKGVVVDIDNTVSSIRQAVEQAQRMSGTELTSVVLGVTGEHISSMNSKGVVAITRSDRQITVDDVERVMEASKVVVLPADREIIHAVPRTFSIDGQDGVRDPIGMSGVRLEVETHLVHGGVTFLQNSQRCVEKAHLEVESMILSSLATSEAVLLPAEKDLGVAMVDIGGGTTDIALFTQGEIYYSAMIPLGGEYVTHDISVGLQASPEEAERIKIEYGCAMESLCDEEEEFSYKRLGTDEVREIPKKFLTHIIEPRMEEIFEKVKQEISKSGCLGLIPAGMVLTGGVSLMPDIVPLATKITGLPTRVGYPRNVTGMAEEINSPVFSTSVGLVQYAAKALEAHDDDGDGIFAGFFGMIKRLLHIGG